MSLWFTLQTSTMAATHGLWWCANSSLWRGRGKEDMWSVWPCKSGSFLRLQFVPHHLSTLCSTPDHTSLLFPERHTLSYAEHTLLFCALLALPLPQFRGHHFQHASLTTTTQSRRVLNQLSEPIVTSLFRMAFYEFGMKNIPARQTGLLLTL